jgi:oxalate decarboxylase/phosphoglucose isomerase-like protein (cupin superfamily)
MVAVTDLSLRDDIAGQSPAQLTMKAGDVSWLPRGTIHATANVGASPATFITLEFK